MEIELYPNTGANVNSVVREPILFSSNIRQFNVHNNGIEDVLQVHPENNNCAFVVVINGCFGTPSFTIKRLYVRFERLINSLLNVYFVSTI